MASGVQGVGEVELVVGAVRWLAAEEAADFLRAAKFDADGPGKEAATPIKSNPLRRVWRIAGPGGRDFYLKRHDESSAADRVKRMFRGPAAMNEWRNLRRAAAAGVAVPAPLAVGTCEHAGFVLTAACPGGNLDGWLDEADWSQAVAEALAKLIASAHAAGLRHGDLHAGNVLIDAAETGPRMWLLDLDAARFQSRPLSRFARIANLAPLVAGLKLWADRDRIEEFLHAYLAVCCTMACPSPPACGGRGDRGGCAPFSRMQKVVPAGRFIAAVHRSAERAQRRLLRSRDRRVMRDSRYFARIRLGGGWRGHVFLSRRRRLIGSPASGLTFERGDWLAALDGPMGLLREQDGAIVYKRSASGCVMRRKLGVGSVELDVFIKHRPWRSRLAALADPLRRSRAVRAFVAGHRLLNRGVATPLPLACLERRVGPVLIESILVTESAGDVVHLEQFCRERSVLPGAVRRALAEQIGSAVATIRRSGLVHRDLKGPNVLVAGGGGGVRAMLADLDAVRRAWPWEEFRPLARLAAGMAHVPSVGRTDLVRLLRAYLRRRIGCQTVGRMRLRLAWRLICRKAGVRDQGPGVRKSSDP